MLPAMQRSPAQPKAESLKRTDGLVEVGVGHDDQMVLGPAGRLNPLAVPRAGLVDVPRHRRRADERDRAHQRMRQQCVDALAVAVHDVEDPFGQPRLQEQLTQPDRRQRDFLGRLEHERVAAGDRDREHPERDHRGEVERGDPHAHADRVADRLAVNLPGDVRERSGP